MESKLSQKMKILQRLNSRIQFLWREQKKQSFQRLKCHARAKILDKALFKYVGKESQAKLQWIFTLDTFQCSEKCSKILQDTDLKVSQGRLTYTPFQNQLQRVKMKEALKKTAVLLNRPNLNYKQIKNDLQSNDKQTNIAVPLSLNESSKDSDGKESQEEGQYITRIRQRKTKRQQYKNRIVQAQHTKYYVKKKENLQPKVAIKKQKCIYPQHFIDMDVEIKQFQKQSLHRTTASSLHTKQKCNNHSLQTSPKKESSKENSFIFTTRQWQPLKVQDRQLVLNSFHMKLAAGVTTRQSSNKSIGMQNNNAVMSRKKLFFLNNGDKNQARIRFNQLISLKKLGIMGYCASTKTMKDVKDFKDNVESNISIDSKQLASENSMNEKKLIKIGNRKRYEDLLAEESDLTAEGYGNYRVKLKMKKEGKVRFDNIN